MFMLSSRQFHCVHKCNTIGLNSFCIAPLSVPKVELGEQVVVPIIELGEQRVNNQLAHQKLSAVNSKLNSHN